MKRPEEPHGGVALPRTTSPIRTSGRGVKVQAETTARNENLRELAPGPCHPFVVRARWPLLTPLQDGETAVQVDSYGSLPNLGAGLGVTVLQDRKSGAQVDPYGSPLNLGA